ncbi:MAG: hydrogenase maturation protease [Actinobacteria bacterium]|nr:hydrogenase maturation protease [Actinomycetota bacterium]
MNKKITIHGTCQATVRIIGFGNKYRSDDGIGIRVIEEIEKIREYDPSLFNDGIKNIEIIDGGTSGIDLLSLIKETPEIIIIDAVDAGQEPGEITVFKEKDINYFLKHKIKSYSLHDLDLSEVIKLIRALKIPSDITIIGIKPKNTGFGETLSEGMESIVERVISIVRKEINK